MAFCIVWFLIGCGLGVALSSIEFSDQVTEMRDQYLQELEILQEKLNGND
jgi:hypothetical protein